MPASGTFGSGQEYSEFVDLNQLGAVVTKGVSLTPWEGNPAPESWKLKLLSICWKSTFHARMLNMVALHLGKSQRWWNTLPVK